jgi:hypothetical protein
MNEHAEIAQGTNGMVLWARIRRVVGHALLAQHIVANGAHHDTREGL